MQALRPRTKIRHALFGLGVIVESKNERTTIAFDTHGVKKFVTELLTVELGEEPKPPKPPKIPKPRVRIVSSFKPPKPPKPPKGPRVYKGKPPFGSLPGEAATLERMKALSDLGCQKIAAILDSEGLKTRYGSPWSPSALHGILFRLGLRTPCRLNVWRVYGTHEEEKPTLARIKALRATGMGCLRIADALNTEGIKPRRGKQWWAATVGKVLRRTA